MMKNIVLTIPESAKNKTGLYAPNHLAPSELERRKIVFTKSFSHRVFWYLCTKIDQKPNDHHNEKCIEFGKFNRYVGITIYYYYLSSIYFKSRRSIRAQIAIVAYT